MKKKKIIIVLFCVLLAAVTCIGAAFVIGSKEEIALKENQRYVYAYVTSIQGNEITYMEIDESVVTSMLEPETEANVEKEEDEEKNGKQNAGSFPSRNEMPDMGNFPGGNGMPDMSNFPGGGEMPDMSNFPGGSGMPDMGNFPGGGEMPDMGGFQGRGESQSSSGRPDRGNGSQQGSSRGNSFFGSQMQFGSMTETVTTYIPVGVVVHTAADVPTTFSRLASGDLIKILVESNDEAKDIIEEIWMLQ